MTDTRTIKSMVPKSLSVQLSVHYYVLSIGEQTSRLYEGFRDRLIDIQNGDFPFEVSVDAVDPVKPVSKEIQFREFLRKTDRLFAHYFEQDPLRLVVVGEGKNLTIFESVTAHQKYFIGKVEGDYTSTSPRDLGKIVWPVVREIMAGSSEKAISYLETGIIGRKVISGLESVGHSADIGVKGTLFVEEDYHVKGGIDKRDNSIVISDEVDIREVIDDAVDVLVEKVLQKGGNVVFLENGSLIKYQRIALMQDERGVQTKGQASLDGQAGDFFNGKGEAS